VLGQIWTTFLYDPLHNLLVYLYINTGSLGLALVFIILFVRIILTPFSIKQYADMKKLQAIKPLLEKIKEKYPNDNVAQSKAQAELNKKVGYNPLGCFITLIIQIIIIAPVYQSMNTFTQFAPSDMPGLYAPVKAALDALKLQSFNTSLFGINILESASSHLNFNDLSATFPYIILILVLALSNFLPTYVNMKLFGTNNTPAKPTGTGSEFADAFSQSMNTSTLFVMPIITTVTVAPFPAIISVYLIIQNFIGLVQQILIRSYFKRVGKEIDIDSITV
jgi:YidC/Oxa1 family membrane protein insertase